MIYLYKLNLIEGLRIKMIDLQDQKEVSKWLKQNGEQDLIYEVWNHACLHSRWIWKGKKWGKMSKPKK